MVAKSKPRCYQCGTAVRSMAEHLTSAGHRARVSSVQSSGPAGSHAYTAPGPRTGRAAEDEYYAELERQEREAMPPTVDELPPVETPDPTIVEYLETALGRAPGVRAYVPDPCPRCGQTFRTENGASWHLTRNPRCEKWRPAKARKGIAA